MKERETMDVNDESIKKGWADVEYNHVEQAIWHLKQQEEDVRMFLADCVAAICGIEREFRRVLFCTCKIPILVCLSLYDRRIL